jgi:hypothetical protein
VLRLSIAAAAFAASLIAAFPARADEPAPPPLAPLRPAAGSTDAPPASAGAAPVPAPASEPNVRAAMAVGAAAMLLPGLVGGTRTALGADEGKKVSGLLFASGGFALAPIVSHMIVREWGRAAAFGALPAAMTIASSVLISQIPDAVYRGDMTTRTTFGIFFGVGLLSSVIGLVDTSLAGERARERRRAKGSSLMVMPSVGKDSAMLTIGGLL